MHIDYAYILYGPSENSINFRTFRILLYSHNLEHLGRNPKPLNLFTLI